MKKVLIFLAGIVFSVILLLGVAIISSHYGVGADRHETVTISPVQPTTVETLDEPEYVPRTVVITPTVNRPDIYGFLSRVEYNNNVAYFLGSMHLGRENWFPLNPMVEDAMSRSDVFAFETDLRIMGTLDGNIDNIPDYILMQAFELILYIYEWSMLPDGMTLEDILHPDVFENLIEMLETYPNITYEDIAYFTPLFAAQTIMNVELFPYSTIAYVYSVDLYVMNFGLAHNRQVIGLNDIFTELYLASNIPLEIQIGVFEDFQDFDTSLAEYMEVFEALAEAYEMQDAERIRYLFINEFQNYMYNAYIRYLYETFIYRTSIYANESLRLLRETEEPTTFFITVGAGHILYGHLFSILEANGLEIVELWR